ncbi:hypothetical protein BDW62DRAFT_199184 [Aspergillus aurantiobrunneus]
MAKLRSLFTRSSSKNKKSPAPVKLPTRLDRIPSSPPPPYQKEAAYIADQLPDDAVAPAPTAEPEPTVPRRKRIRTILKKCAQPLIRFSKTKIGRGLVIHRHHPRTRSASLRKAPRLGQMEGRHHGLPYLQSPLPVTAQPESTRDSDLRQMEALWYMVDEDGNLNPSMSQKREMPREVRTRDRDCNSGSNIPETRLSSIVIGLKT